MIGGSWSKRKGLANEVQGDESSWNLDMFMYM